jgi:hypothetical protein
MNSVRKIFERDGQRRDHIGKGDDTRARIQCYLQKREIEETAMAEPGTLHDAFLDELRDAYDA